MTKSYIVKKVNQSPFNQDDLGKDAFVLIDIESNDIYAEIDEIPWYIKIDDILNDDDFEIRVISKRSKHLVVGDSVNYSPFFEGVIEKIDEVEKDCWDWEDRFHLKDCKSLINISEKNLNDKVVVTHKDCEHKKYKSATIKISDDKIWKLIIDEVSKNKLDSIETIEFIKGKVKIK